MNPKAPQTDRAAKLPRGSREAQSRSRRLDEGLKELWGDADDLDEREIEREVREMTGEYFREH